jgi:NOL1/NOP2/sun family protein
MAKRKDPVQERQRKRELWIARTVKWSGLSRAEAEMMLARTRTQSFRLNPLVDGEVAPELLSRQVAWCPDGYELIPEHIAEYQQLADSGRGYIQNAASWLPVLALQPAAGERILDLCAAPGGKSSHIQALASGQADLVCNDNSKPRLMKLQANLKRLNAPAEFTLADARHISRRQLEAFDKILLDAPCSGEGLMSLNARDASLFDSWSVAHIRRLSDLQKRLILEAWRLLKPGGTLVYSTCTMAPEENEAVVDWLLRRQPDAEPIPIDITLLPDRVPVVQSWNDRRFTHDLSDCLRLMPGVLTEAFFVAVFRKTPYAE